MNIQIYVLRRYNNKDVDPSPEVMQKVVDLNHKKIDLFTFGFSLPIAPNVCLHKSTTAKSDPFSETHKILLEKVR